MMRRRMVFRLAVLVALLAVGGTGTAANQAGQAVNLEIEPVNELAISGNASLLVNQVAPGGGLADAIDSNTTYAVTTNQSNMKITAGLDAAMPTGLTLKVRLAAPAGALSRGDVTLTTTAANVVTGISQLSTADLTIAYTLSATLAAGTVATYRTVTFTLTAGG